MRWPCHASGAAGGPFKWQGPGVLSPAGIMASVARARLHLCAEQACLQGGHAGPWERPSACTEGTHRWAYLGQDGRTSFA